ncbi:dynamin family protein [Fictibacillus sp. WQ 8-8]|uniref:dynamin family protein n=1 Tax=Fictibacillus sp. WQ 8-8 TaxID=2938788 RepID=UPI00210CCDB8|nr:dynamin family protein [Fictibacillus sp. WQ 8-8]MCQ6264718.1 dynamin family protein [Fictibacillus sp. WQ 8-8]
MSKDQIHQMANLSKELLDFIQEDHFLQDDTKSKEILHKTITNLNERRFVVSVIAAMKAGKSTTFNAFLGRDLLPNENEACTTAITEIKHAPEPVEVVHKVYKNGDIEMIRATDEATLEENFHKSVRETRKRNEVSELEKYYLETPIKSLEESEYGEFVQNFILVDTPGPNEAKVEEFEVAELQRVALEQLKYSDALIMLLDYQTYKSETNAGILRSIFENRDDLAEDQDKIVFLVNKIDAMTARDGSVEDVIERVKQLIRTYAPVIEDPEVYAFSAKQAILSRAVLNGNATDAMKQEMKTNYGVNFQKEIVHEGIKYSVVPEPEMFAGDLLQTSKITEIEKSIIEKMFNQASEKMIQNGEERFRQVVQNIIYAAEAQIELSSENEHELISAVTENKKKIDKLRREGEGLKTFAQTHLAQLQDSTKDLIANLPKELEAIISKHIGGEVLESPDKDDLKRQAKEIQSFIIENVQMKINQEFDKIQRLVMNKQIEINSGLNQKFYDLSDKANEIIGKRFAIQFQTFSMEDIAVNKSDFKLNEEASIKADTISDGSDDDFGRILKKTLTAAGTGFGAGVILPGIGNLAGAVVGGIAGFLNAIFTEESGKTQEYYTLDLNSMKKDMIKQVKKDVDSIVKDMDKSLNQASKQHMKFIENQMEAFISNLKGQLDLIIKEYQKNKGNIAKHVAHMEEIKHQINEFSVRQENILRVQEEAALV